MVRYPSRPWLLSFMVMGTRQDIWRLEVAVPRRQTPPTMLAVLSARLRSRATSAIHGPTPSIHHLP
jgi:hypothetical protein